MSADERRCEPFTDTRDRIIVRTSTVGIVTNVFLAVFKAAVGLASHSIAVVLDAVNNLSDALSSIITIVGTKLSGKLPEFTFFPCALMYLPRTIFTTTATAMMTRETVPYSGVSGRIIFLTRRTR